MFKDYNSWFLVFIIFSFCVILLKAYLKETKMKCYKLILSMSYLIINLDLLRSRIVSTFEKSPNSVKLLVEGLTKLSNTINPNNNLPQYIYKRDSVNFDFLYSSLREDFKRCYLFSGEIEPEIYDK